MTTWTTFETIDETPRFTEVFIDRLGCHSYSKDDRTRFHLVRGTQPKSTRTDWVVWDLEAEDDRTRFHLVRGTQPKSTRTDWVVWDLEAEDDQKDSYQGTMLECVQWVSGRVLYGA